MENISQGIIAYKVHRSNPELGILCLICSAGYGSEWGVVLEMPGKIRQCSECNHCLTMDEQKRYNQWQIGNSIGANYWDNDLNGIEAYMMTTAGFTEARRLSYLLKHIDGLETDLHLAEQANRRHLNQIRALEIELDLCRRDLRKAHAEANMTEGR